MSGQATAAKTVVVADDTEFVRDRFASALRSAGHEAITAASVDELMACLAGDRGRVDLLVLDLRLPPSRGVEVVRSIRQVDGGRLPVVVFSGTVASADEVRELAALGVSGYVNEYSGVPHILPALAPHLFPDSFNRRTSPRVTLAISISYRLGNTIAAALTLNISKGGLGVRTLTPPPTGSKLRVRFRLPGVDREIAADVRIVWSDRRVGMGLQFERAAPADQAAIDDYVDQHFFSNRRA